ncbi:MAG: hypothetical protein QM737_21940 [Ferruginibacter sp.]
MNRTIKITVFLMLISWFAYAQEGERVIDHDQLQKYKIDQNKYEFGWLPGRFREVPCFRDYTGNKIQTRLVDKEKDSILYTSGDPKMYELKIIPASITLNKTSRLFKINGQITGAWESVIPSEFEIYIGHRNDTLSNITISPDLHGVIYYNGVKVDTTIVIDVVPAFYLTNFKKFNAYRGLKNLENSNYKEMLFDISAVIDEKSILVFGLTSSYTEIFEIGKLLADVK